MNYNTFRKLFFVPSLLIILALASCQKDVDPGDPVPPIPDEVKDSTLLIESITHVWNAGLPDEDSITEHYSYDTVNRQIKLWWTSPEINEVLNKTEVELNYNAKGLLSHVDYSYPATYTPHESDYSTIDITYDSENVLQNISTRYGDGSVESKSFTKTLLSNGRYQLSWEESNSGTPDETLIRRAVFDSDGRNIINAFDRSFIAESTPAGDDVFTNVITTDSLVYDASGNVIKVLTNKVDTLRHTNENYVSYDFISRQSKGDQLYNQRLVIMNGIANMPFGDLDSPVEDAFGVLSFNLEYEYLQYSKYPVQQTKARIWDESYQDFTSLSEFDSKNRLTKFKGFFNDLGLAPIEYRIKYYK